MRLCVDDLQQLFPLRPPFGRLCGIGFLKRIGILDGIKVFEPDALQHVAEIMALMVIEFW